jgi:hypothetical protein
MDKQAILEETTDVVEKTLDAIEKVDREVVTVVKNNPLVLAGVAVVSLAAGAGLGFVGAKKYLEPKYEQIIKDEVAQAEQFYAKLNKVGPYSTPETAVDALHGDEETPVEEILEEAAVAQRDYAGMFKGGSEIIATPEGTTVVVKEKAVETEEGDTVQTVKETTSIFVNNEPIDRDRDFEAEAAERRPDKPYVITLKEFMENANDDTEMQLTYFSEDDTLVDENDDRIDDIEGTVGEANLKRFGEVSEDRHVVHVRHEAKGLIFEIARTLGSYSKEVLGIDDDPTPVRNGRRVRSGGDD